MHLLGFLCTIYLRFSGSNPTRLWPSENTGIMLKSVIHSLRTSLYMCTLMYIRFLCSAQDPKKLYMQGFWYFARSRTCKIQVFPRNPAKFPKKHEIPRNPPEKIHRNRLFFTDCFLTKFPPKISREIGRFF